jgi:hypothetical protein
MGYSVRKSENVLFIIKVLATIGIICGVIFGLPKYLDSTELAVASAILVYIPMLLLYIWFYKVYLVAYLKGNGICISENQFPDIFSLYKSDIEAVKFVLAHELGHVKQKHNQKRFWTFPSSIIPFLTPAYSRACEYTCDNIGGSLIPDETGRLNGLLLLAGGKHIYKEINIKNYLETAERHRSFAVDLVNLFISHPYLPKRIENLQGMAYK